MVYLSDYVVGQYRAMYANFDRFNEIQYMYIYTLTKLTRVPSFSLSFFSS